MRHATLKVRNEQQSGRVGQLMAARAIDWLSRALFRAAFATVSLDYLRGRGRFMSIAKSLDRGRLFQAVMGMHRD
jgi:hypothetical protein